MLLAPLFALAIVLPQVDAAPSTLQVGGNGAYATPAAAVVAARAGDTIRVAPGVYRGALVVDRRVVMIAERGAVLDGAGAGSVVTLAADSIELIGFEIRGSGRSLDRDEAAVKVLRCTGCRVINNRISDALHGIYLLESHDIAVVGNTIHGDTRLAEARRGNGIHLFQSSGSRLENNTIRATRDGMYFSFASGNVVSNNDIRGVRYGLHYMYSDDNRFERNRFEQNAAGAAIMFSRRIVFRENTFARHIGYRAYGILLQTAYEIVAERNRIEDNLVGVFLDMSSGNTFRENLIAGNGIGIDMIASAEDNTFVRNAITGNRTAVRKPNGDGVNTNRWAEAGQGNYWGDRSVFDLDGDDIGDRPYRAGDPFATMAALRPALEVFTGTLAGRALSWAEEAFPVFNLPRVVDPAPLVRPPAEVPAVTRRDNVNVPVPASANASVPIHVHVHDSSKP